MDYNRDKIKTVVWRPLQDWTNGFFPSVASFCQAQAQLTAKMPHLCYEKCVCIYTTQNTAWQSEANWSRWPLLNHITGDHISLFIGHKRSTSVSIRLTFPYEIFEWGFFTSISLLLPFPYLFKPACATYIKLPPFFLCSWTDLITDRSRG